MNAVSHLLLREVEGGSIGGMATGVRMDDLGGGTAAVRTETEEGLPVEAERAEGAFSTKFRPN